jgi:drug/metabolite transporter (DMT)-like permease
MESEQEGITPTVTPSQIESDQINNARSRIIRRKFTITDILLLVCILIWSLNSPAVKILLENFKPLAVSQFRVTLAGLVTLIIALSLEKSVKIAKRHLPLLLLAAFLGITANQVCFVYALSNTTVSEVSLLYATNPVFATLLAALFVQEKIKRSFWLSLPLAFLGVGLIILNAPGASLHGNWLGDILTICTAASWAGYSVALRALLRFYSPIRLSAWAFLLGGLMLLPFSLSQVLQTAAFPSYEVLLLLLFSAVMAMVLTNIIWYNGVKKIGTSRTAYYTYLQPFFGVIAAALLLGDTVLPFQILGGLLVIGSLLVYRLS